MVDPEEQKPEPADALLAAFTAAGITPKALLTTTLANLITGMKGLKQEEKHDSDATRDMCLQALGQLGVDALEEAKFANRSQLFDEHGTKYRSDHKHKPAKLDNVIFKPTKFALSVRSLNCPVTKCPTTASSIRASLVARLISIAWRHVRRWWSCCSRSSPVEKTSRS